MALPSVETVAFSMPGGEVCVRSRSRPIDLDHLARQTMGDRALEQEVLRLFLSQAMAVRDQVARAEPSERKFMAHGLKGAARGIGAVRVAEAAGEVEDDPDAKAPLKHLVAAIDEAHEFIVTISR